MTTAAADTQVEAPPRFSWALLPAFGVSLSGFLLFGLEHEQSGYPVLVASVILGFVVDRDLGKSLLLIGFSLGVIGTISLRLTSATATSFDGQRAAHRRGRAIRRRPLRLQASHRAVSDQHWPTMDDRENWYLASVVGLAWVIMRSTSSTPGLFELARGARAH